MRRYLLLGHAGAQQDHHECPRPCSSRQRLGHQVEALLVGQAEIMARMGALASFGLSPKASIRAALSAALPLRSAGLKLAGSSLSLSGLHS